MSNQPVVIENETKVFYTVHVNEVLFVTQYNARERYVKVSDGKTNYYNQKNPLEFEKLEHAKKAAELCGGMIKKHIIHTLATETIEEVNINE